MAAVGLAVGGGMFVAAGVATILALALVVTARPVKQRLFPNRKEARQAGLILAQDAFLAELRSEVDAADVHLDRIVVRPSSTDEDTAELVLVKGTQEGGVLSLIDELRPSLVVGVLTKGRKTNSTCTVNYPSVMGLPPVLWWCPFAYDLNKVIQPISVSLLCTCPA